MRRNVQLSIPQIAIILVIVILATTITVLAATGTTDAANAPGLTSSYTLEDIYARLTSGTNGTQSTFTEPAIAPGTGSMHDLNDIMAAAPQAVTTNGATADQVLQGQSFWGLTNGQWGQQTGNLTSQPDITGAQGLLTFDIPNGYYAGRTATASDIDLLAGNIRAGKNIFGVEGQRHGGCVCNGQMVGDTGTRWCDNENGTITDMHNECLIWTKNASCISQTDWVAAHHEVQFMINGTCGLTDGSQYVDWRLPTMREMEHLTHNTDAVTSSTPQGFSGVMADLYWTVSDSMQYLDNAYAMNLSTGYTYHINIAESHYVWAVRNDY